MQVITSGNEEASCANKITGLAGIIRRLLKMGFIFPTITPISWGKKIAKMLCHKSPVDGSDSAPNVKIGANEAKLSPTRDELRKAIDESNRRFAEILEKLSEQSAGPVEPKDLLKLETRLHVEVAQSCLDPVVAALIQDVHHDEEIQIRATVLQQKRPHLRLQKSNQRVRITLLGGSEIEVITPYYLSRAPKGRGRPRKTSGRREADGNGLYPVLKV